MRRTTLLLPAALLFGTVLSLTPQSATAGVTVICNKGSALYKCADDVDIVKTPNNEYLTCGCKNSTDCAKQGITVNTASALPCSSYTVNPAAAPGAAGGSSPTFKIPSGDLPAIFGRAIRLILGISGSLAFGAILLGGFLWLTSAGNPETITKARNIVVWAALGLLVIFVAYALVATVLQTVTGAVGVNAVDSSPSAAEQ